jgi:hypothetical protein
MINKKILMIIGIILLVAGATYAAGVVFFAGNAHEDITDGLVLSVDLTQDNYIAGTKTFTDESSKKHNLISANAATFTTDKYGKSTGAMIFSGTNDYLANSANEPLNDKWTIAWWQYKKSVQGALPTPIFIDDTSDGSDLWVYPSGTTLVLDRNSGGACGWDGVLSSDVWQHIVITFNFNSSQNTTIAYINGVSQGVRTFPHLNMSVNNFLFGSYYGSFPFNGSISEIKIWNRDLSAAEVQALYNSTKPKMSASSIESGLVGHWALNSEGYNSVTGRVDDKTPYENYGTNYGATLTTDRMGQSNGAMSFDGSNDYIDVGNAASLRDMGSAVTVAAWAKYNAYGGGGQAYSVIAVKGYPWTFLMENPDQKIRFRVSAGGVDANAQDSAVHELNRWYYFVGTYDGENIRIYKDGVQVGFTPQTGALGVVDTTAKIGTYQGTDYNFNGSIADVRIYNRALSAMEINTLYNSYNPRVASDSLQKGLVLDMPLTSSYTAEGAAGSELIDDRTPYSNDGQNYGTTVGNSYTSFDGNNDYVLITDKDSLDLTTDFTISAWIYPKTEVNYYNSIVNKGNWRYYLGLYNDNRLDLWINNAVSATAASGLSLNTWYHIAWVHSSSSGDYDIVYVNGDNSSSLSINGNLPDPSTDATNLGIGAYADFGSYAFNGSMSDVKIYNRALSDSEIKLLYDKGR